MATKKKAKPQVPRISLGEFAQTEGIKETIISGFKVWLKDDLHSRPPWVWRQQLDKYMKS